jgi:hypothetical protein
VSTARAAARRLARAMHQQHPGPTLRHRLGTIASVTAGAAADGSAAVSVTVDGNTIPAPYLASYTPTVSDVVSVLLVGTSPLILGKPIGLPVV